MSSPIRRLCIVTDLYPSRRKPSAGAFVRVFARAVRSLGVDCTVVHPVALHEATRGGLLEPEDGAETEGKIRVLRVPYVSLSTKRIAGLPLARITQHSFTRAVRSAVRRLGRVPDAFYGHFLYAGGAAAVKVAGEAGRPSFVGVGEGRFWSIEPFGDERARGDLAGATGFVAVSSPIAGVLRDRLGVPAGKIRVFPNGPDLARFFPRDRRAARRRFGWPEEPFLVGFVGHFVEAKGPLRVLEAVSGIEGAGAVFVGRGGRPPSGPGAIWAGELPHEEVPWALSACDVFVLPTTHEGSCNAVAEAMACGLPVVTSAGDFMDDLVDDRTARRVDPYDVEGIREAVVELLRDADGRRRMGEAGLERSRRADSLSRARNVLDWMAEHS